jgi:hypothetical protein
MDNINSLAVFIFGALSSSYRGPAPVVKGSITNAVCGGQVVKWRIGAAYRIEALPWKNS